uniref:Uncharacterized protein n=1 Tax=Siphoviridae sp. ct96x5 TaxID=2825367 RepID=A0A8S5PTI4_9CAUD|nr:MAG TPA: hypothetical protein [Siphoviridae sp. ct96x5]
MTKTLGVYSLCCFWYVHCLIILYSKVWRIIKRFFKIFKMCRE